MSSKWAGPGVIPPPPGVTPNFVNPPNQLQGAIELQTVCLTVVTAAVGMRLYTRLYITRTKMGLDDAFCILSYLLTVTFSGMTLTCYTLGIGRHLWDVDLRLFTTTFRLFTISQYIYLLLSLSIKLTFLVFYYRIFSVPSSRYRLALHSVIAFVVALNMAIFFATLFNCNPRESNWDPTVKGTCIEPSILPWLSGASSSFTDIIVLVVPVPIIWGMNMAFNKKLRVIAVFGIGLFACIASLVRMGMTRILYSNPDRTWNIAKITIWATLEVNVGIICSCLVFLPAFLERHVSPSARVPLSRLWDYTLSTIGVNSKKSTSSLRSRYGQNATWPVHESSTASAKDHPFIEMKPGGSNADL